MLIDLIISPAKAGPVDIHVYTLSPVGREPVHARASPPQMSLPVEGHRADHDPAGARRARTTSSRATGPVDTGRTGTATCNDKFSIPFSGKWLIVIRALRNEFDEVAVQTTSSTSDSTTGTNSG